jgi:RNA polymerase sigma-70 factor (family 1)
VLQVINKTYSTDQQFISALKTGEEPAFAHLYQRFHQRMYFFARRFVEVDDAKDVVSEAFIALWKKRDDFEDLPGITHYLFLTIRSRCLDIIKHQLIRDQKYADILHLLNNARETDLDYEQLRSEIIREIYAEVDKLPHRMREVFLLSFAQGLKPADIARQLHISVQTVSNQKLSAIRLLQAALGDRHLLLYLLFICAYPLPDTTSAVVLQ